jgi:hypothetical protein
MGKSTFFTLKYDGSALQSHEMDVKELSPALFALGEAVEETNRILNGTRTKVVLNVKAFKDGSLGVDLNLIQDFATQALDLFNNSGVTGSLNLLQILLYGGAGISSLVKVIKWIQNRKIKNVVKLTSGNVRIELEDSDQLEIDGKTAKLLPVVKIRKSLEAVIYLPLQKDGVDEVSFISADKSSEVISKDESKYFLSPELQEEPIDEREYEISLQIINAVFQENNKWRFSDGATCFWAEVQDQDFLKRVQMNSEAFAKDDILRVKILRKQFEVPSGLRTEFFILQVIAHKSALSNYPLPFSEDNSS